MCEISPYLSEWLLHQRIGRREPWLPLHGGPPSALSRHRKVVGAQYPRKDVVTVAKLVVAQ
ncbi:hypothetical protein BC939DRAFT_445845 [Gamsiella multidivaricata]|uniref:uncharacterized protein n=1 Tax=Gamsiella multidivaricata TaxID=101098 RepID=UPI002220FC26|nr:uncharacterized protein BC939DRAFT_445845 [Gamsiella multidivaricata]KAI7827132.1 hypothetical protein BC939DRAFT_445845 [Gamsiella multidivaricata]